MSSNEHQVSTVARTKTGFVSAPRAAATLSDEHSLLLSEVATRADALLHETGEGRWPEEQLRELIDYLHLEILQQVVDEERLVFRAHRGADGLAGLHQDHLELRQAIDVLAQALANEGTLTPELLAARTRDLLVQLEDHLAAEEQVLASGGGQVPPTSNFGARPHEWYALTAGPVIDLDRLPGALGFEAVLDRMLRLAPGEQVELRANTDPDPIWRRLSTADPGGYGWEILERGDGQWRAQITCRRTP